MKRTVFALLVIAGMLLTLAVGCAAPKNDPAEQPTHDSRASVTPLEGAHPAGSYDEVRTALLTSSNGYRFGGLTANAGGLAVNEPEAPVEAEDAAVEGGASYGEDSFGTNVQVAGIDEADSVKTDGQYLYVLGEDRNVSILTADGANTRQIATIRLDRENVSEDNRSVYYNTLALLVRQDRLALLYTVNEWGWTENDWYDNTETHAAIYDISDRSAPKLLADLGQDGYYNSARMKDGVVYLVSTHSVYSLSEDENAERFIPRLCADGSYAMLAPDRIYVCPETDSPSFTVVGRYDLTSAAQTDACAFTDGTDIVYMNGDALYLARSVRTENASESYQENQYTVTDYVSLCQTEIKRVPLGETLSMDASCTIDGALLNQFSLDVYNGYLRAATTTDSDSYSVFKDETYGWENYLWSEDTPQNSRVTVLDANLQPVGLLDKLAENERIYSVRFIGEIGYVVTYEQIDPVFTIDLSDPTKPTLESALELPGVSHYLHLFSDGKLFGFGQMIDSSGEWNVSEGLQLSMFDVSDPKNVTLEGKEVLSESYSEALYDHHAILVNGTENLIAFPMYDYDDYQTDYAVYRYDNGSFTERGTVQLDNYPDGARGILLGGCLYICSPYQTFVIDLTGFSVVATIGEVLG